MTKVVKGYLAGTEAIPNTTRWITDIPAKYRPNLDLLYKSPVNANWYICGDGRGRFKQSISSVSDMEYFCNVVLYISDEHSLQINYPISQSAYATVNQFTYITV